MELWLALISQHSVIMVGLNRGNLSSSRIQSRFERTGPIVEMSVLEIVGALTTVEIGSNAVRTVHEGPSLAEKTPVPSDGTPR